MATPGQARETQEQAGGRSLGVLMLTVFLDLVGFSIIFPLFPEMLAHYLGVDGDAGLLGHLIEALRAAAGGAGAQADFYTQVLFGGVLGSVYSLLQFLAAPMWGALSDRVGRRPVMLATITGAVVSYGMWVVAGSFTLLLVARVIGGIMAGNISVATAAVADCTDARSRTKAMGMLGATFALGFIVGPAIGGGLSAIDLTDTLSWLPGINPFSAPALGAFALTLWNLLWVLSRFRETLAPEIRAQNQVGRRPVNPLVLARPTRVPGVDRTNLINLLFIGAFAGAEFTLTFLARDRFGYTARDNVWIFLFVGVTVAAVQGGLVRRLAPKVGERPLTRAGILLTAVGLVVVGPARSEAILYAGLFLLAVGTSLATPAMTSLISLYAPEERRGELIGVFRSFGSLGRAIGPLVTAVAYWRYGPETPYTTAAVILLAPFLLALRLPTPPGGGARRDDDAPQATATDA
ncbi:MAG: MFS transporter [Nannocystaceae bacterium]|nr:MFS transporter [Myxococcales bacterium]